MSFLAELKRRRVIRTAIVYAAVGYATLEVADVLVPALLLPEWTFRLVALLVVLGAPVTLVLAWHFDVTPEGVVADRGKDRPASRILTPAAAATALVFLAIGFGAARWLGPDGPEGLGARPAAEGEEVPLASVAVLPFQDMSPGGDQAYFSDGIAEEIIHALARVPGLNVPARTSSFAYRGRSMDARAIGDSLGVGAVLEGSVRKDGELLRITAQLVEVEGGFHLWSETYDRRLTSVFEVQEEIARAIVEALRLPLGLASTAELVPHRTSDVGAYETYLEARDLFNARGSGVSAAVSRLEDVVAKEPSFVPAWALLAEAYAILVYFAGPSGSFVTDPEAAVAMMSRAQEAAERALALDSLHAPAQAAMGTVARERLDWSASERYLRRALELDPEYAEAHSNLGEILFALDRSDEAREHHLRAIELEPRTWIYRYNMGWLAYVPIFDEAALEHLEAAEQIRPGLLQATQMLAFIHASHGRHGEAKEVVLASRSMSPYGGAGLLTILTDLEEGRQTDEGREALRTLSGILPAHWLLYGDTVGAARHALDLATRYPYYWGGFLGGLPELMTYPDFREARRRKNLPVRE